MRWAVRLVIVVLAVQCAFAQSHTMLSLAPCEIVALGDDAALLRGRWLRQDVDPLLLMRMYDPRGTAGLEMIGEMIAPRPLPGFGNLIVKRVVAGDGRDDILRYLADTYTIDPVRDIDSALLDQAIETAAAMRAGIAGLVPFLIYRAGDPGHILPLTAWVTIDAQGNGTDLYLLVDTVMTREIIAGSRGTKEVSVVVAERYRSWTRREDSVDVAAFVAKEGAAGMRVYAIPAPVDVLWTTDSLLLYELELAVYDALNAGIWGDPVPNLFHNILSIMRATLASDTTFTMTMFKEKVLTALCKRYSEYDCEYDFDVKDSVRWRPVADAYRTIQRYHLALPARFYAVVVDDRIHTLLAFAVDTGRTTPMVLTEEAMRRTPAMHGIEWRERLMRSIRAEECWARRMEGF